MWTRAAPGAMRRVRCGRGAASSAPLCSEQLARAAAQAPAQGFIRDPFCATGGRGAAIDEEVFAREKRDILGKDKSSKGTWDEPIVDVLEQLNANPDYCTLSSCSGRSYLWRWSPAAAAAPPAGESGEGAAASPLGDAAAFYWPSKKAAHKAFANSWRFHVCHSFEECGLRRALLDFAAENGHAHQEEEAKEDAARNVGVGDVVWLKFEPLVCHVACRSWEAAARLMEASNSAFPLTSLRAWRKRFVVQVVGEDSAELPVAVLSSQGRVGGALRLMGPTSLDFVQHVVLRQKFERNGQRTDEWRRGLRLAHRGGR